MNTTPQPSRVVRETLPQHLARAYPDGAPAGLVPIRLVPVQVFGGDCKCHLDNDHDDNPCHGWGYGLMDAVPAWSDCNRATGHIFRRDEPESPREPEHTITVWITPAEAEKFSTVYGD